MSYFNPKMHRIRAHSAPPDHLGTDAGLLISTDVQFRQLVADVCICRWSNDARLFI